MIDTVMFNLMLDRLTQEEIENLFKLIKKNIWMNIQ